eukprot:6501802-Heterocapsa_arctica.AAC.1
MRSRPRGVGHAVVHQTNQQLKRIGQRKRNQGRRGEGTPNCICDCSRLLTNSSAVPWAQKRGHPIHTFRERHGQEPA